jgi:hypothetical protein
MEFDDLTLPELMQKHSENVIKINELAEISSYMCNKINNERIQRAKIISDLQLKQIEIDNLIKIRNV